MRLNVEIKKRHLYLIMAMFVFLAGVVLVIAYGGNQPSVMGHTAEEIEGLVGGLVYWANIDDWMTAGSYTGSQVCQNIGKTCSYVLGSVYRSDYYGGWYSFNRACTESIIKADWSTDGYYVTTTTGNCAASPTPDCAHHYITICK